MRPTTIFDDTSVKREIEGDGFAMARGLISPALVEECLRAIEIAAGHAGVVRRRRGATYAIRDLLYVIPEIRRLADDAGLRQLIEQVLGAGALVTRAILFDKNPAANWAVPWHQDLTIAVRERLDVPGFGPWSVKAGVVHVQPPAHILERMLTARIHLDDCGAENGALRVVTGSHRFGVMSDAECKACRERGREHLCAASAGDVLFMRPLLLHASDQASSPAHRRIVHLEFAAGELPGGLRWHAS